MAELERIFQTHSGTAACEWNIGRAFILDHSEQTELT